MSTKVNIPVLKKDKSYSLFKLEVEAWEEVTELPKKKQGLVVALNLPEDDDLCLKGKVLEEVTIANLKKDDGLKTLMDFLDKHLCKDELEDSLEKFSEFEDYEKSDSETISQYIANFDNKYSKILFNIDWTSVQ